MRTSPSSDRCWEKTPSTKPGAIHAVTEDGVTSPRLYDGIHVVAEGSTQLTLAPNGQTLSESTTTTTTRGKTTTTTVTSVDVLTDVLGSAVATASNGVISADLALFGDFGDPLTTSKTDTVTGFTGKIETVGLVEFVARTYDPSTRQWVQDDRYRGTVTRAASMNRYAYVEGAPETFVDHLGFYRARAALEAQRLAALQAANEAAAKARAQVAPACSGYACYSIWQHQQDINAMNAKYAQMYGPPAPGTMSGTQAYTNGLFAEAYGPRTSKTISGSQAYANGVKLAKAQNKSWLDRAGGALSNVLTAQVGGSKCTSIAGLNYAAFTGFSSCQYQQAPYYESDPLADAAEWSAAFGDTVTFGGTEQIRRLINYEQGYGDVDMVDHDTMFYEWGGKGGDVANIGLAVIGFVGVVKSVLGRYAQIQATVARLEALEAGGLVPTVAEGALTAEAATNATGSALRATTTTAENGGLGRLVSVTVDDPAAAALAQRIEGAPSVRFVNGPANEFDAVSSQFVAQAKPANFTLNQAFRNQAKATFEVALESGRVPYFQFDGPPGPGVLEALARYAERYGIEPVIDLKPLGSV